MNNRKLSPAQELLVGGLLSLLAGAGAAMVSAVGLSYTSVGLNFPVLFNIGLIAFGTAFFTTLKNYVPAHMRDIAQATEDAYTQVLGSHQATISTLNNVIAVLTTQAVVQPRQAQPMTYVPKVIQTQPIDIPGMPTQSIPVVLPVDLMAGVPQNTLSSITGGVTGQFVTVPGIIPSKS